MRSALESNGALDVLGVQLRLGQVLPYTTFQSENPEDLWKWMTEWEKTTGGKILAIVLQGQLA